MVKWGACVSLLDNKQREFTVSSFRAHSNGGPDESGVPGYAGRSAMEAGARDLSWRTAQRIRRRARGKAGRFCVTPGPYSGE